MTTRPWSRLRPLDAAAVVWALVLTVATVHMMGDAINRYDEGILLTNAHLLLRGQAPYRDFYSNYPPGIFLVIAALWKLFGVHAILERVLGLAIHVAIALVAGRLAGRIVGRRAVPLAAALALDGLMPAQVVPYAYLLAVALLLGSIELALWARQGGGARAYRRWLCSGVAFGAVGCFRHDVFVYAVAIAIGLAGFGAWRTGRVRDRALWRAAGVFALGALVPLLALWIPTLLRAGLRQPAFDLYFDQVRHVLPARRQPLPHSLEWSASPGWPAFLPLPGRFPVAVALTFAAPALAVAAGALAERWRLDRMAAIAVGAAGCALLPQMLGRTDIIHAVYTLAPGVVLAGALLDRLAARERRVEWALALFIAVDAVTWMRTPQVALPEFYPELTLGRSAPLPSDVVGARRKVLEFVSAHSRADDPLFVGCTDHRRLIIVDVDLYFLADRVGATRILQFDPGTVTRADVQETMVAELEQKRPPVAVLATDCWWWEPNRSHDVGATILDDYLHHHYIPTLSAGPYRVLTRRGD